MAPLGHTWKFPVMEESPNSAVVVVTQSAHGIIDLPYSLYKDLDHTLYKAEYTHPRVQEKAGEISEVCGLGQCQFPGLDLVQYCSYCTPILLLGVPG